MNTEEARALHDFDEPPKNQGARATAAFRVLQQQIDYFGALKRKYQAASALPWLAIDPDPPSPGS
jgi:hypothetical protein